MPLSTLWFVIVAIFWCGFFVLEGFDFGVGMLHSFIGRNDIERRMAINSIGPFWDGNEVWLIVAGAAIFAAFPGWYATWFSALYLAVVLLLLALMVRGVSFEYGRKVDRERWRQTWRWCLTLGSLFIPLLLGVALGDLLHGLPIDSSHEYTGHFWNLLTPYGIYTGVTLVVLSLLMGCTFLGLKTTGELRTRSIRWAAVIGWVSVFVVWGHVTWTHLGLGHGFVPSPLEALALVAVIGAAMAASAGLDGWAFLAAAVGIASTVGTIFGELYPRVMVSSTNKAYNLTVKNTVSPSYTLHVMTVVALIVFPVVLIYQGWSYHIFKGRLTAPPVEAPPPVGPVSPPSTAGVEPAVSAPPMAPTATPAHRMTGGSPRGLSTDHEG
jgi:cytochrome d ubiquinol oxidase subunit II